jgi:hypothetical protein
MERATTWRSSRAGRWLALWAQRLGWTLLYGLLVCGSAFVLFVLPDFVWPEDVGLIVGWPALDRVLGTSLFVGLPLGLLVVAFLIGVRLRSTWWGFGPPLAFGLAFFVLLLFTMWIPPPGGIEGWSWTIFGLMLAGMIAVIPCSLAGLAGVWWGKRRHGGDSGPERLRSGGDASTERRR